MCLPGQQSEETLLYMLVTPTSVMLGSAFLAFLSGLVASLVSPSPQARKLMARISVFFVLYGLPQTCVVGSLVYEMIERKHWRQDVVNRPNIEVMQYSTVPVVRMVVISIFFSPRSSYSGSSCG